MSKANKASRAQKKRWKNFRKAKAVPNHESEDESIAGVNQTSHQNPPDADLRMITSSNPVITIPSDCDSDTGDSQTPQPPQSVVLQPAELYWMPIDPDYQTKEDSMDPLGIPLYAQDDIADSSDDEACNNDLVNNALFPLFTRPSFYQPSLGKRKTKDGRILKRYKQP